ncbi:hypothetical protein Tsp_10753 [Trichinella spiralis]|uniref:hypothetical protein n=1 Tax=Trichinella spiralis TaxID=6334 RepID=UPI0001EFD30E|nr:hypothetical protein Tsp_10753 [Trichinella spiralis]
MTNSLGGIVPSGLNIQVKSSKNDPSSISEFSVAITFAIFEKLMMFSQTVAEYVSLKSVNECALVQDVKFEGLLYFVVAYKITMLPVRRVTLCKCEGKHCRWHSATCTLCYANAVAMFPI